MFKWLVKQFWSLSLGLEPLAVEFGGLTTEDAVNFGVLPYIVDLPQLSMSGWIYSSANVAGEVHTIMGFTNGDSGWSIYEGRSGSGGPTDHRLLFRNKAAGNAAWYADVFFQLNTLTHFVITYDRSDVLIATPKIYLDGVLVAVVQQIAPGAPIESENGSQLVAGNIFASNEVWNSAFEGTLKDLRIYNRILSSTEVTTLYNSGAQDDALVTDGLIFQGPCVRTKDYALYEDETLTESLKVLDNVYGVVGTPHGSPVGRAV